MTPNHEYPLRIPKDLWSDLTAIKEIWNTSHKALMTEACIDLVKKKQMKLYIETVLLFISVLMMYGY